LGRSSHLPAYDPPMRENHRPPPAHDASRPRVNDSHVRLRSAPAGALVARIDWLDAQEVLDELCEDQLTLSVNLACLEETLEEGSPAARGASRSFATRLDALGAVRDALAILHTRSVDPRLHRLFVPDAPLAEYLRGVYAWTHAVVRALDHLLGGLRAFSPDWAHYRWRLEEAKNFHFDELDDAIHRDLEAVALVAAREATRTAPKVAPLSDAIDDVLGAARALEECLDARFG
jgi:hypothetical protein